MEDVKVVNSFCDVTYDFGIHFAHSHLVFYLYNVSDIKHYISKI